MKRKGKSQKKNFLNLVLKLSCGSYTYKHCSGMSRLSNLWCKSSVSTSSVSRLM